MELWIDFFFVNLRDKNRWSERILVKMLGHALLLIFVNRQVFKGQTYLKYFPMLCLSSDIWIHESSILLARAISLWHRLLYDASELLTASKYSSKWSERKSNNSKLHTTVQKWVPKCNGKFANERGKSAQSCWLTFELIL